MDPQASQTIKLDQLAIQKAQSIIDEVNKMAREEVDEEARKGRIRMEQIGQESQERARRWIRTVERLANKAIGVLQEQGVYALFLFLFSRGGDEGKVAPVIRRALYAAIKRLPDIDKEFTQGLPEQSNSEDFYLVLRGYANNVLNDLDTLLLVQELYRQILIYTLYSAKAVGG